MGQISALYYADYYLSGGHIGVVNTGEEWNQLNSRIVLAKEMI